jgi:hypothetical protein
MAWERVRKLQANLSGFKQSRCVSYLDGTFKRARAIYRKLSGIIYDGDTGIPATDDFNITKWGVFSCTFLNDSIKFLSQYGARIDGGVVTKNRVNLTGYSKLKIRAKTIGSFGGRYIDFGVTDSNSTYWTDTIGIYLVKDFGFTNPPNDNTNIYEYEGDISDVNGEYYIYAGCGVIEEYVYDIWLEK